MTKPLYELQPELDHCQAQVLCCTALEQGWRIELSQTILFPGGGGQLCDRGMIDDVPVRKVFEENGSIFHICEKGFREGQTVTVRLDRSLRLYHSQQHTGEHILSHAFWKLFGAKNIGFHSDERQITIDLDMELDRNQCAEAEWYANEQIWRDAKVDILYRKRDDMNDLEVRKVTGKAGGLLRVVAIEGGDVCTCCGTHVERTGNVGIIKITGYQRHRGGTRLEAMCGSQALRDYCGKTDLLYKLSCELSCGTDRMEDRIAAQALESCCNTDGGACVMVSLEGDAKDARYLLNRLVDREDVLAGVFYQDGRRIGYMFARTGQIALSCRNVADIANGLFNGKGGGSDAFAQGSGNGENNWREMVETIRVAVTRMMR